MKEQIENALYSIQNEDGDKHLFTPEKCSEIANKIIASVKTVKLDALVRQGDLPADVLLAEIKELLLDAYIVGQDDTKGRFSKILEAKPFGDWYEEDKVENKLKDLLSK